MQSVTPTDCWIAKMKVLDSAGSPRRCIGHTAKRLSDTSQAVASGGINPASELTCRNATQDCDLPITAGHYWWLKLSLNLLFAILLNFNFPLRRVYNTDAKFQQNCLSALNFVLFFYFVHLSPKPKLLLGDKMCFSSITQLPMAVVPIFI